MNSYSLFIRLWLKSKKKKNGTKSYLIQLNLTTKALKHIFMVEINYAENKNLKTVTNQMHMFLFKFGGRFIRNQNIFK